MAAGVELPFRFLRAAVKKGLSAIKQRIPAPQQTTQALEPVYARLPQQSSRVPYAQRSKAAKRWYTTSINNILRDAGLRDAAPKAAKGPHVRAAVGRLTTTTPFASALRPRLVGGAFPRSAGGYSIGGPARFFSHTPAAPAQVMSQVSAAMRAFLINGKGAMNSRGGTNGRPGVRAQLAARLAGDGAPGAYVDFFLSPTFTSLSHLHPRTLESAGFMESLGADFGAMLGGITATYSDIGRLSTLGDLPITLAGPSGDILRVHFKGCDREYVEQICSDLGIQRGIVHEDERFALSLLAPGHDGPPGSWKEMLTDSPPESSVYSEDGFDDVSVKDSAGESDYLDIDQELSYGIITPDGGSSVRSEYYEGPEGVHRFLENCVEYQSRIPNWE